MSSTQQLLLAEGAGGAAPVYIEDVFSTWLYAGNSSTQSIVNGIDLSTKGGMVWTKSRNATYDNTVYDTVRGTGSTKALYTNTTNAEGAFPSFQDLTSYNTNGYSIGSPILLNETGKNYVSWTFREQPKFFDIVTYTGNGSARTIAHNLGSAPGCIIIKCLNDTFDWIVWHRSFAANNYNAFLNTTNAAGAYGVTSSTAPTSTVFSLINEPYTNQNGSTYVAYLFAHDAGGFGLTGTDNVISCGSVTANGSGVASINLGYEPQWIMLKNTTSADSWLVFDNMRGLPVPIAPSPTRPVLRPNITNAEVNSGAAPIPNATGVSWDGSNNALTASNTFIYVAIRRGPMKVPTDATKVFSPVLYTGTGSAGQTVTASGMNPADTMWHLRRVGDFQSRWDRLRGGGYLSQDSSAENATQSLAFDFMTGSKYLTYDSSWGSSSVSNDMLNYYLGRAPSFFDVVCYIGNGTSGATQTHNLAATPELMIARQRTGGDWYVYTSGTGATKFLVLNATDAAVTDSSLWNNTAPTSSVFTLGNATGVNRSATNFVAYLFATCAGVSKVGSYTGTGATQTISCGFTGGARFVLIKRTDTASYNWVVWDTARGMVSGTDPRLFLNNTDGESNNDWVFTTTGGFQLVTSNASVNASGGSYIFLAIA